MDHGPLRVVRDGSIVEVTIEAPPLQLVDGPFIGGLLGLLAELDGEPSVRVVVFRSADPDFFLMHGDVESLLSFVPPAGEVTAPNMAAVAFERLRTAPYLSIGVLDGAARGGGCEFLSALDLRAGSDRSVIGQPETVLGIIPGAGGTARWPRLIGRAATLELLLTGRDMAAAEARAVGWLQLLTTSDRLATEVDALARRIARLPSEVIAAVKRVVDISLGSIDEALVAETAAMTGLMAEGRHVAPMTRFLAAGGQTREVERAGIDSLLDAALGN